MTTGRYLCEACQPGSRPSCVSHTMSHTRTRAVCKPELLTHGYFQLFGLMPDLCSSPHCKCTPLLARRSRTRTDTRPSHTNQLSSICMLEGLQARGCSHVLMMQPGLGCAARKTGGILGLRSHLHGVFSHEDDSLLSSSQA